MAGKTPHWPVKVNAWMAFCNGKGKVVQRTGKSGQSYFLYYGPQGEKFRSWKKCMKFIKKVTLPVEVEDPVHIVAHNLTTNKKERKVNLKVFSTLKDNPPASNKVVADPKSEKSKTAEEKWVGVDVESSSERTSALMKYNHKGKNQSSSHHRPSDSSLQEQTAFGSRSSNIFLAKVTSESQKSVRSDFHLNSYGERARYVPRSRVQRFEKSTSMESYIESKYPSQQSKRTIHMIKMKSNRCLL